MSARQSTPAQVNRIGAILRILLAFSAAQTALAWGLVKRVVRAEALDAAVAEFADTTKARSAATIRLGKRAFYAQIEQPIAGAYDVVAGDVMACNMMLDDASEGIDAFLGKREPVWQGR